MIGPATREDCIKKYDELKLKTLDNEATGKVAKALNIRITKKTSARLRGLFLHNIRRKQLADIQNVDPAESAVSLSQQFSGFLFFGQFYAAYERIRIGDIILPLNSAHSLTKIAKQSNRSKNSVYVICWIFCTLLCILRSPAWTMMMAWTKLPTRRFKPAPRRAKQPRSSGGPPAQLP